MDYLKHSVILCALILTSNFAQSGPLSPVDEPKADSFYICYEKRCPNDVTAGLLTKFTRYKYIGCIISKTPCHLYCGDKFKAQHTPLHQFQWVNTYPGALNAFYRCAYS